MNLLANVESGGHAFLNGLYKNLLHVSPGCQGLFDYSENGHFSCLLMHVYMYVYMYQYYS